MSIITIKSSPSRTDLLVFAAIWLVFFALLAGLSVWTLSEYALLYMACFTGIALLGSLAFNSDFSRRSQAMGAIIPLVLGVIWVLEHVAGVPAWSVFWVVTGVGVLGAVAVLASPRAGAALYRGWMLAAMPIGWTISAVLMAFVYYVVLTPIGLVLRAVGHDAMRRKLDPTAATYWIEHHQQQDRRRYFRQF